MSETTVYYAVPGHYTITRDGVEHQSFEAAVADARSTIVDFDFGGQSRAFVDQRVRDATGDRPLKRWEVFRDRVEVQR